MAGAVVTLQVDVVVLVTVAPPHKFLPVAVVVAVIEQPLRGAV